jgi:hypothetical protein
MLLPSDIAEEPLRLRPRALSFYIVLLWIIVPLWSTLLISWAFVIYALHSGRVWTFARPNIILFAIALCEVSRTSCLPA